MARSVGRRSNHRTSLASHFDGRTGAHPPLSRKGPVDGCAPAARVSLCAPRCQPLERPPVRSAPFSLAHGGARDRRCHASRPLTPGCHVPCLPARIRASSPGAAVTECRSDGSYHTPCYAPPACLTFLKFFIQGKRKNEKFQKSKTGGNVVGYMGVSVGVGASGAVGVSGASVVGVSVSGVVVAVVGVLVVCASVASVVSGVAGGL